MTKKSPAFKRILLKLSGEALMGEGDYGIDPDVISRMADEIRQVTELGIQVGMVIGGGNIFRGAGLAQSGIDRVTGDHMGMLATVMNSLAMQDALERHGVKARVMSALMIHQVCEDYIRRRAIRHLEKGRVVICAAGTGNPFFTTDSAGVYSADPVTNPDAVRYDRLSFDEVIDKRLQVMDATAFVMCRDHGIPLRIFNIHNSGDLVRLVKGEPIGTVVE